MLPRQAACSGLGLGGLALGVTIIMHNPIPFYYCRKKPIPFFKPYPVVSLQN